MTGLEALTALRNLKEYAGERSNRGYMPVRIWMEFKDEIEAALAQLQTYKPHGDSVDFRQEAYHDVTVYEDGYEDMYYIGD